MGRCTWQCVELSPRPQRGVISSCPVIRLFSELPRMSLRQIGEHDRPVVEQPTETVEVEELSHSHPLSAKKFQFSHMQVRRQRARLGSEGLNIDPDRMPAIP
jgi:hypothetical protein